MKERKVSLRLDEVPFVAAMQTRIIKQRNDLLKDLKALEAEVDHALKSMVDLEDFEETVDLTRSEKYETDK